MDFDIEKLQTLLDGAVASGEEDSCQLAIYKSGRLAVDICAGKNCRSNTLFPVYSVSKGLTSTLAHILYEEGRLDFEAPVSEYWPEFGCNGKENIKVWHIFSHRAGLWQMPLIDKFADQADWQKMVEYMQNATPEDPGGKCHYHGITFGWLAGEVIARAGKKSCTMLELPLPEGETLEACQDLLLEQTLEKKKILNKLLKSDGIFSPEDRLTAFLHRVLQKAGVKKFPEIISCNRNPAYLAGLYPRPASIDLGAATGAELGIDELFRRISGGDSRADDVAVIAAPQLIPGER